MDDHYQLEVFSPDETLDSGAGYAVARWRQCEPERNLLAAVLKDALLTYKKHFASRDARFKETERWIFGEDTDRLFAFKTLCAMLGLSAERIRKELRDSAGAVCYRGVSVVSGTRGRRGASKEESAPAPSS
ncbi:MAG TPA: hypothetical protein VK603_18425 [Candidatus Saccharimonadales bacterium]|nr:hypothetical protein [Candidatus Saccharimonadales bacterium]